MAWAIVIFIEQINLLGICCCCDKSMLAVLNDIFQYDLADMVKRVLYWPWLVKFGAD